MTTEEMTPALATQLADLVRHAEPPGGVPIDGDTAHRIADTILARFVVTPRGADGEAAEFGVDNDTLDGQRSRLTTAMQAVVDQPHTNGRTHAAVLAAAELSDWYAALWSRLAMDTEQGQRINTMLVSFASTMANHLRTVAELDDGVRRSTAGVLGGLLGQLHNQSRTEFGPDNALALEYAYRRAADLVTEALEKWCYRDTTEQERAEQDGAEHP